MIRSRTLRGAARILLGAFVAAYAIVSVHAHAKASQPIAAITMAHHAEAAAAGDAADSSAETHCLEQQTDPSVLLCKHHCQSVFQTLDHPHSDMHALASPTELIIPDPALTVARKPLVVMALRLAPTHHGGSPPPYAGTARLRI